MTATIDLLIIGDGEAALCAAAVAARTGASTRLLRSKNSRSALSPSYCNIPNFVWRRLDLQDYGLKLEPVSARVTLLPDGAHIATHESVRETTAALAENGAGDHEIWPDFVADMRRAREAAEPVFSSSAPGAKSIHQLSYLFTDARDLAALSQVTGSAAAMLDDYLNGGALKTHIAAHAMSAAGFSGREAGSAPVLATMLNETAWRVRAANDGPPILRTLEKVCKDNGVVFHRDDLMEVAPEKSKRLSAALAGGETLKPKIIIFASPEAAALHGYHDHQLSAARRGGVTAQLKIKLKRPVELSGGDDKAVFQIVDNMQSLQAARDQAADGKLPDEPPVEFEFADNGDLVARTTYCPKYFREENGPRGWTGQDRQALSKRMLDRLEARLPGLSANIRKKDFLVCGANAPDAKPRITAGERIFVLPFHHDAVAEAVKLVDRALGND